MGNINDIVNLYNIITNDKDTQKEGSDIDEDDKEINDGNNNPDEITIIYNSLNKDEIKLFGDDFIKINESNCSIIIDGEEKQLCSNIKLNPEQKKKKTLKIILKGVNNITNMGSMFYKCSALKALPNISKLDTKTVHDMSCLFRYCNSLKSLPDISKWDTKYVTDMSCMFFDCDSISFLIFLNGTQKTLLICMLCFINVVHYHLCLIFLNGIQRMLKI